MNNIPQSTDVPLEVIFAEISAGKSWVSYVPCLECLKRGEKVFCISDGKILVCPECGKSKTITLRNHI